MDDVPPSTKGSSIENEHKTEQQSERNIGGSKKESTLGKANSDNESAKNDKISKIISKDPNSDNESAKNDKIFKIISRDPNSDNESAKNDKISEFIEKNKRSDETQEKNSKQNLENELSNTNNEIFNLKTKNENRMQPYEPRNEDKNSQKIDTFQSISKEDDNLVNKILINLGLKKLLSDAELKDKDMGEIKGKGREKLTAAEKQIKDSFNKALKTFQTALDKSLKGISNESKKAIKDMSNKNKDLLKKALSKSDQDFYKQLILLLLSQQGFKNVQGLGANVTPVNQESYL